MPAKLHSSGEMMTILAICDCDRHAKTHVAKELSLGLCSGFVVLTS